MKNIFISSTFIDMQAERDMVQKKVLPALRDEARKYGENVGVIDLRWGVDTSTLETEEGAAKVLKVCLDEIDRSHPYMLIFLGERYGTMMREDQIESSLHGREDKYTTDDYVKSITALEVEYGALSEKYGELNHCVVCFREPVVHMLDGAEKDLYAEHKEEGKRKLAELKARIKHDLGEDDRLITYSCTWDKSARQLVDFTSDGKPLEDVLTKCYIDMFRDDWKEYERLSWQEKEQLTFHALMESKLRSFVGREALLEEYYANVLNGDCPLILQGEVGSGKTSLMCKLIHRLQAEGKNVFAFFSGMGSMSTSAELLVKQMVYYMENLLGVENRFGEEAEGNDEEGKKASYTDWIEHLHELCSRLQDEEKVYFCIDALDQLYLDEHVEKLDFFMDEKNVQVIASCTDLFELPAEVFVRRKVEQIPALSEEDAKVVARGILSSYSRDAYDTIEKEILGKKSIGNPLYISLLIQRLIMMDQDELRRAMKEEEIVALGTEIIRDMPDELEDAVVSIISSAIDKVSDNEDALQEMMNYLAASRSGLRLQDLQGLFAYENMTFHVLDFTLLMKYLDSFFYLHEDDRIDFTHKVIRQGLLKLVDNKAEYDAKTGAYVTALGEEDSLRLREGMYYARILKNYSLAEELLIKAFEENNKELQKKIKEEALEDEEHFYCSLVARCKEEEKINRYFQDRFYDLFDLSQKEIQTASEISKEVLKRNLSVYSRRKNTEVLQHLCTGWNRLGKFYEYLGNQIKAQQNYKHAISMLNELISAEKTEHSYRVYMETYRNSGRLEKEKGGRKSLTEALRLVKESLRYEKEYLESSTEKTAFYRVAESYILLGEISSLLQQEEEAVTHCEAAINLVNEAEKGEKEAESLRLLADSFRRMGTALSSAYEEEATACYEKALEIRSGLYAQNRDLRSLRDLSEDYVEFGKLKELFEKTEEAVVYRKRAMLCQKEIYRQNKNPQSMAALADSYTYFGGVFGVETKEGEVYIEKSREIYYELGQIFENGRGVEKNAEKEFEWYRKSAEQGLASAQFKVGYMYESGQGIGLDYRASVEWYRKAAEQGNASAQCNLGHKYEYGLGVERDYEMAVAWYQKSAEQGVLVAQDNLGLMWQNGRGVTQNYEEAVAWYRRAAEKGHANGQCNLGLMYENGYGIEQSYEEAVAWYRKAAEKGHKHGQCNLGYMYEVGRGTEQNYEKAVEWYQKAATQGLARAQCNLGYMYEVGRGVEKNYEKAAEWYRKAAEQGYERAQNNYGELFYYGRGVEKNYEEAICWYEKAAEQQNQKAMYTLGWMYAHGQGFEKNYEKAQAWYLKSAEQGHEYAQYELGEICYYGRVEEENYEEAIKWYEKAAEHKNSKAEYMLGWMNARGQGFEKNYEKAREWYLKSAERGYMNAQYELAELYYFGRGMEKNYEEAIKWYEKAAEQKDRRAEYTLGWMNAKGQGFEVNHEKAFEWYHKSAERGYTNAQYELAELYYYGRGVEENYEEAIKWYEKAIGQKNGKAEYMLGWMNTYGQGCKKNYEKAMEWYQKSAEQNHAGAQCEIGELYYNGYGVKKSYEKAMEWYQKAAALGNTKAKKQLALIYEKASAENAVEEQFAEWEQAIVESGSPYELVLLAYKYREGEGVPQDDVKAAELYRKAAETGYAHGQWSLGWMYEYGRGVVQSYETAKEWYEKAALQGSEGAQRNLGELYEKGLVGEKNEEEAAKWYEMSAEQGDIWAQCNLGLMYADGRGVKKNESRALELLEKASEAGVKDARLQFKLGEIYDIGRAVRRDGKKAADWYQKAVEQNYAPALCNMALLHMVGNDVGLSASMAFGLYEKAATQGNAVASFCMGLMCLIGQGTPKSDEKAVECFRQAAEQEHANARFMLSLLYGTGRGVEKDETEAERWYIEATEQGRNEKEFDTNMLFRDCASARENLGLVVAWHEKMAYSEYSAARCNLAYMLESGRGVEADAEQAKLWYEKAAGQGDEIAEKRLEKYRKKTSMFGKMFGKASKK